MAKKYYAVRKGKETGIFNTWDECKRMVHGFSNAAYRSFTNYDDALAYLNDRQQETGDQAFDMIAYVDGSYDVSNGVYSYGLVVLQPGCETFYESEADDDAKLADMRNVAGELAGARRAMHYALEHGAESLLIVHDYNGIEKWCTKEWKANKAGTRDYVDLCDRVRTSLSISFQKVKSHSGDTYNDMADQLAKQALMQFKKG